LLVKLLTGHLSHVIMTLSDVLSIFIQVVETLLQQLPWVPHVT